MRYQHVSIRYEWEQVGGAVQDIWKVEKWDISDIFGIRERDGSVVRRGGKESESIRV